MYCKKYSARAVTSNRVTRFVSPFKISDYTLEADASLEILLHATSELAGDDYKHQTNVK